MPQTDIYLNCACFSLAVCFALVLVFTIVTIKFNPRDDQRHNKLTLIPYYSCFIFSSIMMVETIFINADFEP
jgi:hypothetical protein